MGTEKTTQGVEKVSCFREKILVAHTLEKVEKCDSRRLRNDDCPWLIPTHMERLQFYLPPHSCLFANALALARNKLSSLTGVVTVLMLSFSFL